MFRIYNSRQWEVISKCFIVGIWINDSVWFNDLRPNLDLYSYWLFETTEYEKEFWIH